MVQQLLLACDPTLKFPTETHFLDSWGRIREAISDFKGEHDQICIPYCSRFFHIPPTFTFYLQPGVDKQEMLTTEHRSIVGEFVMHSVTEKTAQTYGRHWADWCHFVLNTGGTKDPFFDRLRTLVGLLLHKRHEEGIRGKQDIVSCTTGKHEYYLRSSSLCLSAC